MPAPPPEPGRVVPPPTTPGVEDSKHLALGRPRDADESDDVLLDRGEMVISYNPALNVANWVAWRLERDDLGPISRSTGFHPDTGLPRNLYAVQDGDYVRSGYDRGHLCPSADRTRSRDANLATFVLSNVHPQLHELNAGPWEDLEKHGRELARSGEDLYVVAGGLFERPPPRIGHGVSVPKASFKVIVSVSHGAGLGGVTERSPTIAVIMPNDRSVKDHPWNDFAVSIRDVERASGYDFDGRVPRPIQDAIEERR